MSKRIIPKEYLGAFKKGHRKSAREFIDEELAYRLLERAQNGCEESRKALEWLTQFNNEFHKAVINKTDPKAFHNTDELRKECNQRSYAQKNDLFTRLNKSKKQEGDF